MTEDADRVRTTLSTEWQMESVAAASSPDLSSTGRANVSQKASKSRVSMSSSGTRTLARGDRRTSGLRPHDRLGQHKGTHQGRQPCKPKADSSHKWTSLLEKSSRLSPPPQNLYSCSCVLSHCARLASLTTKPDPSPCNGTDADHARDADPPGLRDMSRDSPEMYQTRTD